MMIATLSASRQNGRWRGPDIGLFGQIEGIMPTAVLHNNSSG
jgi:hypothetical protein